MVLTGTKKLYVSIRNRDDTNFGADKWEASTRHPGKGSQMKWEEQPAMGPQNLVFLLPVTFFLIMAWPSSYSSLII